MANTLATDGLTWAELFSYERSGTYNNEWQVIDLEKFTPGTKPTEGSGLLTILEEIPGIPGVHVHACPTMSAPIHRMPLVLVF